MKTWWYKHIGISREMGKKLWGELYIIEIYHCNDNNNNGIYYQWGYNIIGMGIVTIDGV